MSSLKNMKENLSKFGIPESEFVTGGDVEDDYIKTLINHNKVRLDPKLSGYNESIKAISYGYIVGFDRLAWVACTTNDINLTQKLISLDSYITTQVLRFNCGFDQYNNGLKGLDFDEADAYGSNLVFYVKGINESALNEQEKVDKIVEALALIGSFGYFSPFRFLPSDLKYRIISRFITKTYEQYGEQDFHYPVEVTYNRVIGSLLRLAIKDDDTEAVDAILVRSEDREELVELYFEDVSKYYTPISPRMEILLRNYSIGSNLINLLVGAARANDYNKFYQYLQLVETLPVDAIKQMPLYYVKLFFNYIKDDILLDEYTRKLAGFEKNFALTLKNFK